MTACFMKYKASLWSTILFSYKFDIFWLKLNSNKCHLSKESDTRGFTKKKNIYIFGDIDL